MFSKYFLVTGDFYLFSIFICTNADNNVPIIYTDGRCFLSIVILVI